MWTFYVKQTTRVSLIRDTECSLQLAGYSNSNIMRRTRAGNCLASPGRCAADVADERGSHRVAV